VAVAGALAHRERHRAEVSDLNVFPVADGDTGDNVAQTVRAVLHGIDTAIAHAGEPIARTAARAALLGARGNSGVILSRLVAGAAQLRVEHGGRPDAWRLPAAE
jgi:dihydroxyacetone kinase-like predicted kinase